ncbi:hypothetical protein GIB67_041973 [Kingdonia uniflora]|uniref:60S ribosomal export protein NMD3 n=1 Tax=Kingdonia uniflora TaxID=39325 RepID=A0A7J7NZY9_9MAGN|nr:hypothetical protein GIB67_041973 [Kingdonia uniflora]
MSLVVRQKRGGMPLLGRGWFTHPLLGWVRQIGEPLSVGSGGVGEQAPSSGREAASQVIEVFMSLLQFLRSKSSSWHRSHLFLAPYVPDPAGFRSSNQNQMFSSSTPTAMDTDTGMFRVQQTVGSVLCFKYGILMAPNAANMCVKCLRSEVDITEGLQKFLTIQHCPEYDRYLQPPRTWIPCQLESRELLTFCIKRLNLNNKVRLADAEFIWTEPHSKRIKVKVKVRKEVLNGLILEQGLGNLGPLVLCTKVSNNIILVDPFTLRHAFLDADQYWRVPFKALISCRQLIPYIVLDVEPVASEVSIAGSKYALADVQIARVSDFGKNDIIMTGRTHLGHLLNPGDTALGYDLYGANINDIGLDKYKGLSLPDAILVKKSYEQVRLAKRGRPRKWDLKKLSIEVDETTRGRSDEDRGATEYENFLKDLEENPELTLGIKLCLNKDYQSSGMASDTEEELPIDEHLAKLILNDSADVGSMDE